MQPSLFENLESENRSPKTNSKTVNDLDSISAKIKGLSYIPEYITQEEHDSFWKTVNEAPWLNDLKRRVQHYGYKYDYKARSINYSMKIGDLPEWIKPLAKKLYEEGLMPAIPDQLIINEYQQGQGIASHIDCEPCFGDTIISLSLGSTCIMEFTHIKTKEKIEILLEPRSLVVMKKDARYLWAHGITGKKYDRFNGVNYPRKTRISLTFRNVILNPTQ